MASTGAVSSLLRADAVVVWLDQRPEPDSYPGTGLRVTVASGCPNSDDGDRGVINPGLDLVSSLLPEGTPTSGLMCEYNGGGNGALRSQTVLSGTEAASLAAAIQALQLSHPDGGSTSCPADSGALDVIALQYPTGQVVDLAGDPTGCPQVANGSIQTSANIQGLINTATDVHSN